MKLDSAHKLPASTMEIAKAISDTRIVCALLLLGDAVLCGLITWKIPYTEIDWRAYMQQIAQYLAGERDYANIYGDTGPLVYPAAHVYIYRVLYYLTDAGQRIDIAQYIFIGLYLATLLLVMQCYRNAHAPAYLFPLLVLSKRLHSIFMLRLFNDCFAVFFLFLAILCFQQRRLRLLGSVFFSIGLGVKMSLLLALPAVGVVLCQAVGIGYACMHAMVMGGIQSLLSLPFSVANADSYLSRAFELTRTFAYRWTVNWRFVDEEIFLSRSFSLALLGVHGMLLAVFLVTRWLGPTKLPFLPAVEKLIRTGWLEREADPQIASRVTPDYVTETILTAVIIGCLCARSLHYQFYVYIAWSTPLLLWRGGVHPILIYTIWAAQEWAWNIYPSTDASSAVVVLALAVTVAAVWFGTQYQYERMEVAREHED
jgi:alpha-1,3-mannosyltransferase